MDSIIEIHGHKNHELIEEYVKERLKSQIEKFPFVTRCEVHISPSTDENGYEAKIETHVKSGEPTFATAVEGTESKALNEAILKTQRQLRKFKDKHEHSNLY